MASPPNLLQNHLGFIRFRCGGDVIWETFIFGGDTIWVTNYFGGDAVLETSSIRNPNFGANLKGQSVFKKNFH